MARRRIEDKIRERYWMRLPIVQRDKPHHCHRRLVAEVPKEKWGNIEIEHIT